MSDELKNYNIYAGLGGSFGGASYVGTLETVSEIEANKCAYEIATEEYESYIGLYGLRTIEEIMEEENCSEEDAETIFESEREDWIDHYTVPSDEDDIEEIYILN